QPRLRAKQTHLCGTPNWEERGAMLLRIVCNGCKSAKPPRKHANLAKPACFRGDQPLLHDFAHWPRKHGTPCALARTVAYFVRGSCSISFAHFMRESRPYRGGSGT